MAIVALGALVYAFLWAFRPRVQSIGPGTFFDVVVVVREDLSRTEHADLAAELQKVMDGFDANVNFMPAYVKDRKSADLTVWAYQCNSCLKKAQRFFVDPVQSKRIRCVLGRTSYESARNFSGCPDSRGQPISSS